jgi:membrane-bound lytic murein transglycosylase B
VELQKTIDTSEVGLTNQHTLNDWKRLGVNVPSEVLAANSDILCSLIQPDGPDGRSFLVYDSFRALMKWNRSTYFATAVGLLADRIKQ